VIGGHLLSTASGLVALSLLGAGETSAAVAVGLAVLLMQAARAMHPPAGIGAMLMASQGLGPSWLLSPVLTGAVLLVAYATLWSRLEQIVVDPVERALADWRGCTVSSSPARRGSADGAAGRDPQGSGFL
jgi:CBS-domain-containing membrane protein